MKSSKNPAMAGYMLKEGYTIKPHDSANIKRNIQEVEMMIKNIDAKEQDAKEHLNSTIHSSGRILTGKKTAHEFDEKTLTELQGLKCDVNRLHDQLENLQTSCTGTFQHRFQSNKSQSRKRKENTRKSVKRKKERHEARTSDILKKIAPEGKINKEILRNLGKREKNGLILYYQKNVHFWMKEQKRR